MQDLKALLATLGVNDETQAPVSIPMAPQASMPDALAQAALKEQAPAPTMPDNLMKAAQQEAIQQAKPSIPAPTSAINENAPQKALNNFLKNSPTIPDAERNPASQSVQTVNSLKTKISGNMPDEQEENKAPETAESRLERLMSELNDQRNKEREDAASRQMKAHIIKALTDNAGTFVGGMQAKNTGAHVTPVQTKGYDVGDLVGQVDKRFAGDREALMEQYKNLQAAKDKGEARKFQQESLELQKRGLDIKQQMANQKGENKAIDLTHGEKKVDENFAKDYNNLTSKGFNNAQTSISALNKIADELEKEGDGPLAAGGGRTSLLPDSLRSNDSVRWRDTAANQANATLKELFPGSLSDDERRAAAKEYYNDRLSNKENAAIIRGKSKQLSQSLADQRAKAEHFNKNGTLKGYAVNTQKPANSTISNGGDTDSKVDSFMKKNNITDRNEAIKILKDAGKL